MTTSEPVPIPGVTAELYRAAIGPRAQDYYLRRFARFDAAGKAGWGWNWAACAFTLNWLASRRMWARARAYLASLLVGVALLFGGGRLAFRYPDELMWQLLGLLLAAAFLLPGLRGNAWYYDDCHERINAALRGTVNEQAACEALARQAGQPRRWWALLGANGVLLALLIAVAQLLPGPKPAESALPTPPALAEVQVAAPVTASAPSPPLAATQAGGPAKGWYVAVGAFAQPDNARKLREQLMAAGYRVSAEPWPPQPGRLTAVRVGPFGSQAEAERVAEGLKAKELPAVLLRR